MIDVAPSYAAPVNRILRSVFSFTPSGFPDLASDKQITSSTKSAGSSNSNQQIQPGKSISPLLHRLLRTFRFHRSLRLHRNHQGRRQYDLRLSHHTACVAVLQSSAFPFLRILCIVVQVSIQIPQRDTGRKHHTAVFLHLNRNLFRYHGTALHAVRSCMNGSCRTAGNASADIYQIKMIESIIKQRRRIRIYLLSLCFHGDTDQIHAIPFRTGDQRILRHCRIAVLSREYSVIMELSIKQHLVMMGHGNQVRLIRGRLYFIKGGSGNRAENVVLQRFSGNQRHIVGTGHMVFIRKAVRIRKMSILTAKLLRSLVHHVRKVFNGSSHMNRKRICRIVGGGQHDGVQAVFHRQLFSLVKSDMGTFILHVHSLMRDGYHLIQLAVLNGKQRRHDLGDAGGIMLLMHVLIIQNGSGGRLHQNPGRRHNGWLCRPILSCFLHRFFRHCFRCCFYCFFRCCLHRFFRRCLHPALQSRTG